MHNTQERIFNMFVNYFIFQILEDYNQKIRGMQKQPDWSEIFWLGLCVKLFSMKYFRYKLLNSFFASGNIIYLLLQSLRQIFEHEWKYFNLNMKRLKSLIRNSSNFLSQALIWLQNAESAKFLGRFASRNFSQIMFEHMAANYNDYDFNS